MGESIAILLSTYNGEVYLREQINSIIDQDYQNWKLYIRDDGSKDSTLNIIKSFVDKYPNIYFIEGQKKNMGAAQSFMHLLNLVDSEYYMFCDQDDVWLPNKLSILLSHLKEKPYAEKDSILIFSDAKVVDSSLNLIDNSLWNYNKIHPVMIFANPEMISIFNCTPGCTMLFNNELKSYLKDDKNILMHDWYIMIKGLQNAKVSYVEEPLLLYRQHHTNVLGAQKISIKSRFLKLLNIFNLLKWQIATYNFVKKYTYINIYKFYWLKLRFNIIRFKIKSYR